jgi:LEA14-like dessication related protein
MSAQPTSGVNAVLRRQWLAAMALAALAGCAASALNLKTPQLSLVSVQHAGGDLVEQRFTVRLRVQNPNERELPIKGLKVAIELGGEHLADGVSAREFTVPAGGEAEFDMQMRADAVGAVLKMLRQRGSGSKEVGYRIKGEVETKLGMFHRFPFEETGKIPLQ